jgi:hypothetical protein
MGVDVATFHLILERGFAELWNSTPITREDVRSHGTPRLGVALALGVALGVAAAFGVADLGVVGIV